MSAAASPRNTRDGAGPSGLAVLFSVSRTQLGLITLLLALAAIAWWSTLDRMRGMDDGPGTELGALTWFLGVWVVMMAAMMFPSVWPTVTLYAHLAKRRGRVATLLFVVGYLLAWTFAGLVAYGIFDLGHEVIGDGLAWDSGGRWLAGGTLVAAAAYELTPLKYACLAKCRSPLGFLLGSWRGGLRGAVVMGTRHGAWCFGCCWALMASLFALGVMSLGWMAVVAAVIGFEKLVPWARIARYATAAFLLVLGVAVLVAPDAVLGLTIPGGAPMDSMDQ
jgi:predicted metal-binding membrane protein